MIHSCCLSILGFKMQPIYISLIHVLMLSTLPFNHGQQNPEDICGPEPRVIETFESNSGILRHTKSAAKPRECSFTLKGNGTTNTVYIPEIKEGTHCVRFPSIQINEKNYCVAAVDSTTCERITLSNDTMTVTMESNASSFTLTYFLFGE